MSASERVQVVDGYTPIFRDAEKGFSVPLVAAGEILGLLNVEYPPGQDLAEDDEPLVIPLANQLSVALRNQNLLGEARYYRDYLRKVIDVANALIVVVDRQNNVAVMNAAMQRYTGWGPEVIGMPLEQLRRPTAPTVAEPRLTTLLMDGLSGQRVRRRRAAHRQERRRRRPRGVQHLGRARPRWIGGRRARHRPGSGAHPLAGAAGDSGGEVGHAGAARSRSGARAQQSADLDLGLRRLSGEASSRRGEVGATSTRPARSSTERRASRS